MDDDATARLIEVTRPRAEWAALLESAGHCREELTSYAMAYRDVGWRDVHRIREFIDLLRAALEQPGDPLAVRLPREAWLRHLDAFRIGVAEVRGAWVAGQDRPDLIARFPDQLAYPSIEASWDGLLAALPEDCRDTERVCLDCDRLLPLAQFARPGYCHDCYAAYQASRAARA